tara:strand:- start:916 stop:1053 length:138 start_codon:yes stop_codon:yes gene_type:complete
MVEQEDSEAQLGAQVVSEEIQAEAEAVQGMVSLVLELAEQAAEER